MTPAPHACPTPIPCAHQLTLPFEGPTPSSPPLLSLVAQTRRMGVRPRTIWRTLSVSQREHVRRTLVGVATALLRTEGAADEHRNDQ
jgi:hypothetical protein